MTVLRQDLAYAFRSLRRTPAFVAALVLTLGLGIGTSAALFSVIDALLLRPLPYGESEELVAVRAYNEEAGYARAPIDIEQARAWSERADFLDGALLHIRGSMLYTGGREPRMLTVEVVSPEFEQVLRVRPALGRGFAESDAASGAEAVVILDHAFWSGAFGADPDVIGERIELNGHRHRVIGVMPNDFKFPEYAETQVWVPLPLNNVMRGDTLGRTEMLGRLDGGIDQAQARATALSVALAEADPDLDWSARLFRMEDERAGGTGLRKALAFLAGAVVLILLVSGVNAVSLLLVRGWSRIRELAVRTALGASRRRLIAQLVTESMLLAVLSGIVATVVAIVFVAGMQAFLPRSLTFFSPHAIEVEGRALGFTFAIAALAGLVVGLVPAIQATRRGSAAAEAGLTPYAARTPTKSRLQRLLVIGAVAVSVVLLVGAGLLMNTFVRLTRVDPGYRVEELARLNMTLSPTAYPTSEARAAFLERLEARLEALPGVEGVTVPMGMIHFGIAFQPEGAPAPAEGQPQFVPAASVTPDYFETFEVPIIAGRAFVERDAGTDNVIIDSDLAGFLWPGANPTGKRFRFGPEAPWLTVVGVVGDLKLEGPDSRRGDHEILYPRAEDSASRYVQLAIRTRGEPEALFRSIRAAVHDVDAQQPISELVPATEEYAATFDMERFLFLLTTVLAALAVLLAAIGIHGLLAFAVTQRQRELGIRIALGAGSGALARSVLAEGVTLAAAGTVLGIAGALALSRVLRGLLYGVEPTDPATIAAVAVVGLVAAAAASYLPARRVTQVDPMIALREE